jgi:hypothetical protein
MRRRRGMALNWDEWYGTGVWAEEVPSYGSEHDGVIDTVAVSDPGWDWPLLKLEAVDTDRVRLSRVGSVGTFGIWI